MYDSEKLADRVVKRVSEISKSFLLIDQKQRDELKKKLRTLHEEIAKKVRTKEKSSFLAANEKLGKLLSSFEKL